MLDEQSNTINIPEVTIITVALNAAKTIKNTIESVLNQNNVVIEYIIIDGGSTDGTVEIIKSYEDKLAYWISQKDAGLYDAMNKGIDHAKGKLIGIINADDWYEPNVLSAVFQFFTTNNNAVIHADMNLVDSHGHIFDCLSAPDSPSLAGEFKKMTINHPATFVPKTVYDTYGKFDLRYRYSADYELMVRLLHFGVEFMPLHIVVSNFRLGGLSGGSSTYRENASIQLGYGRPLIATGFWYLKSLFKLALSRFLPPMLTTFAKYIKKSLINKSAGIS